MDTPARRVVLGAAMRYRPRPVMAAARTGRAGVRPLGPDLRPLHRGVRHRRPRSREEAARVRTHRLTLSTPHVSPRTRAAGRLRFPHEHAHAGAVLGAPA